eukprot:PITA_02032
MYSIIGIPRTVRQHDYVMVVVDKLNKVSHFISVKTAYSSSEVGKVFIGDITDGQIERVNRIVEDMMRMYMMHQQRKWEEYLPLVESTYNNGYQKSLRMSPFKALYGRICNTPIISSDPMNKVLIGPDMLTDMDQEMQAVKKNIKVKKDK